MSVNDPFIVEVEGALGWRRRHYEGLDREEAVRVACCLASRDGADRVTRVIRTIWVELEILGWNNVQHGNLASGPTAREPREPFPMVAATFERAKRRSDPPSELVRHMRECPPGMRRPPSKGTQGTLF